MTGKISSLQRLPKETEWVTKTRLVSFHCQKEGMSATESNNSYVNGTPAMYQTLVFV